MSFPNLTGTLAATLREIDHDNFVCLISVSAVDSIPSQSFGMS